MPREVTGKAKEMLDARFASAMVVIVLLAAVIVVSVWRARVRRAALAHQRRQEWLATLGWLSENYPTNQRSVIDLDQVIELDGAKDPAPTVIHLTPTRLWQASTGVGATRGGRSRPGGRS